MIAKVVKIKKLSEYDEIKDNLAYWLAKSPPERIAAVEYLRRQHHGDTERLQRVVRVFQRSSTEQNQKDR